MSEICSLSLCELERLLQKKELCATDAVSACFDQIEKWEPQIGSFITLVKDEALKRAAKLDSQGPDPNKSCWGVPIAIKDAISTKNIRTTAASAILENFIPFYDAFVIEKLLDAGAIIIGKANMDEFAMGSSTENSAFLKTGNPWNPQRVPGGSSGGSAAAVSAGECFCALGSDTGGSIRQPASFCGVTGLKPTYGRVSRYGLFAFASSLDQIGPIAKTSEDCAILLEVIAGYDARDNTSVQKPVPPYYKELKETSVSNSLKGFTIGIPRGFFDAGLDAEVGECCNKAIELAASLGARLIDIKLTDPDVASAAYYIIAMAEASSNLARYDGVRYGRRAAGVTSLDELYIKSRSQGFGNEVKRRIMLGSYVLSTGFYDAYFKRAAQARNKLAQDYQQALTQCDLILMPVAPVTAWEFNRHNENPLQAYLMDAFTLPVNLAGLPALSLPVGLGKTSGLPVGIQLVGNYFEESKILLSGKILQDNLPKLLSPPLR